MSEPGSGSWYVLSRNPAAGNLLGLAISPVLMAALGWRALFLVFGVMGAPLLAVWLGVVPARATLARQVPDSASARCSTLDLLRSSATWAIIVRPCTQLPCNFAACSSPHHCRSETGRGTAQVVNIVNHWGYFIYLSWMPSYFHQALGLDLRSSSFLAFLPWTVRTSSLKLALSSALCSTRRPVLSCAA